ncbi:hypothetical protein HRI_003887400 [Hibiscus trionum]|uniref:Polyprotein n=1 Tax=Hibiscus trionum TaxID=183268 RepID=A0A9W7ITS4_HIBTR|nr:hypothetical protein HRI_003887400 [Hibiscus trionum]
MAGTANGVNISQPTIPIFQGSNYDVWSTKMKTLFISQDLWDFVEKGYSEEGVAADTLKDMRKKDAKALFFIQQAVDDAVFSSRISDAAKAKEAWDSLKNGYRGTKKVLTVKLQTLRRQFESFRMKDEESVHDCSNNLMVIVHQMRKYGEQISDQKVVEKLLRSLTRKYESTVAAIEESKDLTVLTVDELLGSLQSHEDRHKSYEEENTEKAFQTKLKLLNDTDVGCERSGSGNNREGSSYRGRRGGYGFRGGGRSSDRQQQSTDDGKNIRKFECYYCHKPGHIERYCRKKQYDENQANFAEDKEDTESLFLACYAANVFDSEVWYMDSGCSSHMTANLELFISLDRSTKTHIKMADGTIRNTEGKGVIKLNSGEGSCIKDVLYVPDLDSNLLSVGQFLREGYCLVFEDFSCTVFTDKTKKNLLLQVPMSRNNMFPVVIHDEKKALAATLEDDNWLWHHRYGHLNFTSLSLLSNQKLVDGLPAIRPIDALCESCVVGKQHRDTFPKSSNMRASKIAELIHADVCGPMQTPSLNNNRYFVVFVDDFSRMTWVYFVKEKSEVFSIFRKFKSSIEKQSGNAVKVLRTDRGGEFMSREFDSFCEEMGIHRQLTASYTPQQNGVAERKNRSLVEMAKSMLKAKCLPKSFWAEAIHTATYVLNRSPTSALIHQTPFEAFHERKPKVTHFKIFGSVVHVLIPSQKRSKLDDNSVKCIFVGYSLQTKGYRFYNPETKKLLISRDVVFDEKSSWTWNEMQINEATIQEDDESTNQQTIERNMTDGGGNSQLSTPDSVSGSSASASSSSSSTPPRKWRSLTEIYEQTERCQLVQIAEPSSFDEAVQSVAWCSAMDDEMKALEKNKTWELVNLPKENEVIRLK